MRPDLDDSAFVADLPKVELHVFLARCQRENVPYVEMMFDPRQSAWTNDAHRAELSAELLMFAADDQLHRTGRNHGN